MEPLAAFLAVAAAAMLVPGPDTLVVLRVSLASGVRTGTWAAAGSGTGNLLWGTASVLGVTGLLTASPAAFGALKLAGAAYLAILGVMTLAAAVRGSGFAAAGASRPLSSRSAFARGLASDVLNVKVGLFWTALAPQFLAADATTLLPVAMVVSMAGLAFAWLTVYAWMGARLNAALGRPRVSRCMNAAIGSGFLLLGVKLAVST